MNTPIEKVGIFPQILVSIRIVLFTMLVCSFLYTLVILGVGQALAPYTANGSLIRSEHGKIIGSRLLAQGFSLPEYFWPRPSAMDYNASASGGSNLSPTNPELRSRAKAIITKLGGNIEKKVPADLVATSGSGLDPHITLSAAEYQVKRVAFARGLPVNTVMGILARYAKRPGDGFTPEPLVNVLIVNMALDRLGK
jgi:potassium-transporting ATPase KdpC subunit